MPKAISNTSPILYLHRTMSCHIPTRSASEGAEQRANEGPASDPIGSYRSVAASVTPLAGASG